VARKFVSLAGNAAPVRYRMETDVQTTLLLARLIAGNHRMVGSQAPEHPCHGLSHCWLHARVQVK
jgi:hypothetical protein